MLPRFQGKVIERDGGFSWFCDVSVLGGGDNVDRYECNRTFSTFDQALADLKAFAKVGCEAFQKQASGEINGEYIDMKTNATRRWDARDEH